MSVIVSGKQLVGDRIDLPCSRVLFERFGWSVCLTRAGLSVQSLRTGRGKLFHNYADWGERFDSAIDDREKSYMAHALYQSAGFNS